MKRSRWDSFKDLFRHPDAKRPRLDGFENEFLGFGTSRDKLAFGMFTMGCRLSDAELHALYYSDDVAAKAINKRPAEMLRRGYKLVSQSNPDKATDLYELGETPALQVSKKILRAMQWGRLWGGALIVVGANDSPDLTKPLDVGRVRDVKFLNVVDRRYASVLTYQENPTLPNLGEPEVYLIGNSGTTATPPQSVHASRVVRFVGVDETDPVTSRQLNGWTYSALQRPYDIVRSFAMQFKAVEHLISDASQGVWKISNLLDLLTSDRAALMTRLAFSDMTRSTGRAIMLDAEAESFERVQTSFTGIGDVLDRTMMRLAAAFDYPVTLLMGRSPAGQNATGDSDFRAWYDTLASEQETYLKPALLQVYRAIGGANCPDDLDVEFCPLWEPTSKEKAEEAKIVADTDKIYFDMGAVMAGQVAIARFGSGNGKIEIDEAAAKKDIANEIELMLNPPAPPPGEDPNAAPPAGDDDEDEDSE